MRTFSYQWQRYTGGAWADIGGATSKNYTPTVSDLTCPLRLAVTPSDGVTVYSNQTDPALGAASLWVGFSTPAASILPSYAGTVDSLTGTDSLNVYSVAGGVLVPNDVSSASGDPIVRSTSSFTVSGGLTLIWRYRMDSALGATTAALRMGYTTSTGAPGIAAIAGIRPNPASSVFAAQDSNTVNTPEAFAFDTNYVVAIVLRPSGGFQAFLNGERVWVGNNPVFGAAVYASSAAVASDTTPATFTYWRIVPLPSPFTTDFGAAARHQSSPVSGSSYGGVADGIVEATGIVLPGAPSGGQVAVEVRYNRTNANNYNWARIVRNAGNTAWDMLAGKVVSASSTTLLTVTGVGTPDTLRVIHYGSLHDYYTCASGTWSKRGTQITDSNQSTSSNMGVVLDSTTVAYLDAWIRVDTSAAAYSILTAAS